MRVSWIYLLVLAYTRCAQSERIKIGEYYDGAVAKAWVEVTRNTEGPQPYPPDSSWSDENATLWVGIAAFRDPRCGKTLYNMFTKAAFPNRIHIGLVQQNQEGDDDCLEIYCTLMGHTGPEAECPHRENIRVLRGDAAESAGPTWGRHLQSYMLRDEEFCMQTDSHMDYVQDWDLLMMQEWSKTRNEYGVLSTYVQSVDDLGKNINGHHEVSHLCEVLWRTQIRNQQAKALRQMTEPKLSTTWGAGYSFSKCHAMRSVPYDPYLPQIFDGEEFSYFARLWTHGYDVYTPSRSYIGHDYNGANNKNAQTWSRTNLRDTTSETKASNIRLWTLLGMPGGEEDPVKKAEVQDGAFGLGQQRSLTDLSVYTSLDFYKKAYIGHHQASCGTVDYWPQPGPPPALDNMVAAPYWLFVRNALIKQGDWSAKDELAYTRRTTAWAEFTDPKSSRKVSENAGFSGHVNVASVAKKASLVWALPDSLEEECKHEYLFLGIFGIAVVAVCALAYTWVRGGGVPHKSK